MNVADSERAATGLRKAGYELCESPEKADVVLSTRVLCGKRAQQKASTRIGEVRAQQSGDQKLLVGVMGASPSWKAIRSFGVGQQSTW